MAIKVDHTPARRRGHFICWADLLNETVFNQNAGSGLGIGAGAVDNGRVMKQQSGHVRCLLRVLGLI
jgi:hypothetical protein